MTTSFSALCYDSFVDENNMIKVFIGLRPPCLLFLWFFFFSIIHSQVSWVITNRLPSVFHLSHKSYISIDFVEHNDGTMRISVSCPASLFWSYIASFL